MARSPEGAPSGGDEPQRTTEKDDFTRWEQELQTPDLEDQGFRGNLETTQPETKADTEPAFPSISGSLEQQPQNNENEKFAFDPREALAEMATAAGERFANVLRDRGEEGETGKDRVKRVGKNVLQTAGDLGMVSLGVTYLAVEAAKDGTKVAANKLVLLKNTAVTKFELRRQKRLEAKQTTKMDKLHEEALHDNKVFDAHTEATGLHKHFDEHGEAESMNQYYEEHGEALEMNEAFDENVRQERREARIKAKAARAAKAVRKARRTANRREMFRNGVELGRKGGRFLGRLALKAFKATKRTAKKVASAASAAKTAAVADWKS